MAYLLDDCIVQHRQLCKYLRGQDWSMERLYGRGWEKNTRLAKSGEFAEVDALMVNHGGYQELFDVEDKFQWWGLASMRVDASNGALAGEDFYFGDRWVSAFLLSFLANIPQLSVPTALHVHHEKPSRFQVILNRCEVAASLVCFSHLQRPVLNFPVARSHRARQHLSNPPQKTCFGAVSRLGGYLGRNDE
jgi:hypothetical protein